MLVTLENYISWVYFVYFKMSQFNKFRAELLLDGHWVFELVSDRGTLGCLKIVSSAILLVLFDNWRIGRFEALFLYISLVKQNINLVSKLCSINVLFDFFPTWYWSNKTKIEHNLNTRLCLIDSNFDFDFLG